MSRTLFFGSYNPHKVAEVRALMPSDWLLQSCIDIPNLPEALETGSTLEQNARIKAQHYHQHTGLPCFADDSGLEVLALGGAPGVHSSSYSGREKDYAANNALLLHNLQGIADRRARFRTVIIWLDAQGQEKQFDGEVWGSITTEPRGQDGFGYNPIFEVAGTGRTLAQYSIAEKNALTHRGRAMALFIAYLRSL